MRSAELGNRGIGRARMFMGALLLLAALLTWSIGLMMSAHGDTVARGTEYLRSAVVTFKRKGAVGTLILSAVSAWLLFPARRPKWPARDWALALILGLLAASSIYTLISLRERPATSEFDQNLGGSGANIDESAGAPSYPMAPDLNVPQTYSTSPIDVRPPPVTTQPNEDARFKLKERGVQAEPILPEEPSDRNQSIDARGPDDQAPGNEADESEQ